MIKIILSILIIGSISLLKAQVTMTSGGDISDATGTISYSIGQSSFATVYGPSINVNLGIQQPYSSLPLYIEENNNMSTVLVYPNPFTETITISSVNSNDQLVSYSIFNISGEEIKSGKLSSLKNNIPLQELTNSIYFIRINTKTKNQIIKITKI